MSTLSKKIIGTIEKGNIQPISKWQFVVQNISIWSLGILFLILGVIITTFFFLFANEIELWDFASERPMFLFSISLIGLFLFWGVLSVVMMFLSRFSVIHTKSGYKYPITALIIGIFVFQTASGAIFANTEILQDTFEKYEEYIPFAKTLEEEKGQIWHHPKEGYIAGKILSISDDSLQILGKENEIWTVELEKETQISPRLLFSSGESIRIEGTKEHGNRFTAAKIFPQKGRRKELEQLLQKYPQMKREIQEKRIEIREKNKKIFQQKIQEKKEELAHEDFEEKERDSRLESFTKELRNDLRKKGHKKLEADLEEEGKK